MAKYVIEVQTRFIVETDDIQRTVSNYEFPDFIDVDDDAVEFLDGKTIWEEVS
jgi:hypothetical protein